MKKIIFTSQDKRILEEQIKNLNQENVVDLDKLIEVQKHYENKEESEKTENKDN